MCVCVLFTLEQDGQKKWRGHAPPSLKSGGATGPLGPPGSAAYAINTTTKLIKKRMKEKKRKETVLAYLYGKPRYTIEFISNTAYINV